MQIGHKLAGAALGLLLAVGSAGGARPIPAVAVVRAAPGVPGDVTRDGAAEMLVLLEIARLQAQAAEAGLVAVGDRRGLFPAGAEEVLQGAVLHGLPVVKLARGGRVLAAPHGLFLDGSGLSEEDASRVLARCLELYGRLPAVSAGSRNGVSAALRERLRQYQNEFTLAASTRLAVR